MLAPLGELFTLGIMCAVPPDQDPRLVRANLELERAIALGIQGVDPRSVLRHVEQLATAAMQAGQKVDFALRLRGRACHLMGIEAEWRGEDPLPFLRRAIGDLGGIAAEPPPPGLLLERALALSTGIRHLAHVGEDVRPWAKRAAEDLERLLAVAPGDPEALHARAELSCALGDVAVSQGADPMPFYDRAVADMEAARERGDKPVDEDLARMEACRADALVKRGANPVASYRRAIRILERAIRRKTSDPSARIILGQTLLLMAGALEGPSARAARRRAIASFDAVLRRDSGCVSALLGRAEAVREGAKGLSSRRTLCHLDDALTYLERAQSIAPDSAEVCREIGIVRASRFTALAELGTEAGADMRSAALAAMRDLDRALEIDPAAVSARHHRAKLRLELWSRNTLADQSPEALLEAALADLDEVIFTGPDNNEALFLRAVLKMFRSDRAEGGALLDDLLAADADIEEALRLDPDSTFIRHFHARILLRRAAAEIRAGTASIDTCRRALKAHARGGEAPFNPQELAWLREIERHLESQEPEA